MLKINLFQGGSLKEKLFHLGQQYDKNNDGILDRSELEEFFTNFYQFNLDEPEDEMIKLRSKNFVEKILIVAQRHGVKNARQGVSVTWFSKIDRSML